MDVSKRMLLFWIADFEMRLDAMQMIFKRFQLNQAKENNRLLLWSNLIKNDHKKIENKGKIGNW